jgi:hypothetical protein
MEREKELTKLINVLRRAARVALQSQWTEANSDAAKFCVEQYNRVLARLKELDPTVSTLFEPLAAGSSLAVVAMACRQLAAYYEDEVGESSSEWPRVYAAAFDTEGFKDFWRKCAGDAQDLGEMIRESVEMWARQRRRKQPGETAKGSEQKMDSQQH